MGKAFPGIEEHTGNGIRSGSLCFLCNGVILSNCQSMIVTMEQSLYMERVRLFREKLKQHSTSRVTPSLNSGHRLCIFLNEIRYRPYTAALASSFSLCILSPPEPNPGSYLRTCHFAGLYCPITSSHKAHSSFFAPLFLLHRSFKHPAVSP